MSMTEFVISSSIFITKLAVASDWMTTSLSHSLSRAYARARVHVQTERESYDRSFIADIHSSQETASYVDQRDITKKCKY